ncbi:MAG: metal-binding protein, partial [Thermoplasmatales archaeon]|nr:metal-binding protein [Thermoplasmatales archaeon]
MSYAQKISVFDEIRIKPLQIGKRLISGTVSIKSGDLLKEYRIIFSYSDEINVSENLAGLILTMPVINFTLFTKRLILDFPVSDLDLRNVRELVRINNREVFINKLLRRRYEFFKKEYLPEESDITAENIDGITEVASSGTYTDEAHTGTGNNSVAVLSSGGKESLLSYGILRETGAETHAF